MDVKKKEIVCEAYRNKDLYIVRDSVEIEPPRSLVTQFIDAILAQYISNV